MVSMISMVAGAQEAILPAPGHTVRKSNSIRERRRHMPAILRYGR